MSLSQLPPLDGILISHAHYDHLDLPTLRQIGPQVTCYVPKGLKLWLQKQGFPHVQELGWWESVPLPQPFRLHACPAQHFASRTLHDWNQTLWCGWLLESPTHKIYFAGDTGYCPLFRQIGERFPNIDVALLPIGAYRPRWLMKSIHADPHEAVRIHLDIQSRHAVAGHWGTFRLTDEPPGEPALLLERARQELRVTPEAFRTLRIGETRVMA